MSDVYYPEQDERQIPLGVKYDLKPVWAEINTAFDTDATGAAIVLAAFEAFFLGRPVSYSRNWNYYGAHRHPLITYTKVTRAVDQLEAKGLIHHYRQLPGYLNWQSAFEATTELVAMVQAILEEKPRLRLAPLTQVTILRDAKGKPVDYRRTRAIDRQDQKTEAFNEAITSANIALPTQSNVVALPNLACPMARIYNRDFNRGGRYYARGPSWQNTPKDNRRGVTINDEPTVELDFDGMHIAMLYARRGLPISEDCYAIDGWPRKLAKVATLTLINATTQRKAQESIAHNGLMSSELGVEPGSAEAKIKATALIKAVKARHVAIADSLHSDAGASLMRDDSDMAEIVMTEMTLRKGIIALPIHDSFLVPVSKRADLEEAMIDAAHKVTGSRLTVSEK
ncbi:hypothetical protein [Limimaricola hongkongensis]|nr:hypothetical protein [Limimaricola hongkongensis]